jgi:hypothetical protein
LLLAVGWLLAVGCYLLAVGCYCSSIGCCCWLSAVVDSLLSSLLAVAVAFVAI